MHQGFAGLLLIHRHRYTYPELVADGLSLAKNNPEDESVHRVILPIEHEAANNLLFLTEAIHTSLSLFVAGWVPC